MESAMRAGNARARRMRNRFTLVVLRPPHCSVNERWASEEALPSLHHNFPKYP